MYKLLGFVKITEQINNVIGVVSTIGELSTYSTTFSKEKGTYTDPSTPGISFVSFSSKTNNNEQQMTIPSGYVENVLQVAYRAIQRAKTLGQAVTVQDIASDVFNQFPGLIQDFQSGPIVSTPNLSMPEWISWVNPVLQAGDNRIQIWFSDQAFKRQYDDYEVVIVNPIDDLMDFMREHTVTAAALDSRDSASTMELINDAKAGNPETTIRAQTYEIINPLNPNKTFKATWHAIVYGNFGDNPDIVKAKIIEQLVALGTVNIDIWRQVVPSLFKTTEFLLVPFWSNQAIPDRTTQAGIYSPFTSIKQTLENAVSFFNDIESTHTEEYLQSVTVPFRSLCMYSLGGKDNLGELFKLTDIYSDLINVGTSTTDFSRMSIKTQEFALMLEELTIIAENEQSYAQLPTHTRRLMRYGKLWLVRSFNNVQYLMFAKSNTI